MFVAEAVSILAGVAIVGAVVSTVVAGPAAAVASAAAAAGGTAGVGATAAAAGTVTGGGTAAGTAVAGPSTAGGALVTMLSVSRGFLSPLSPFRPFYRLLSAFVLVAASDDNSLPLLTLRGGVPRCCLNDRPISHYGHPDRSGANVYKEIPFQMPCPAPIEEGLEELSFVPPPKGTVEFNF